jgi:hypothetical protein
MSAKPDNDAANAPRTDETLAQTARQERDYLRERLRAELGREPGDDELDEWLREHTEGY